MRLHLFQKMKFVMLPGPSLILLFPLKSPTFEQFSLSKNVQQLQQFSQSQIQRFLSQNQNHQRPAIIITKMLEPFLDDEREPSNYKFPEHQHHNQRVQNLLAPTYINPSQGYEPPNRLQGRQSEGHCKSLMATIFLIIGAIVAFAVKIGDTTGISLLIFFASYVIYLVLGCYNNQLMGELDTLTGSGNFSTYYEQLRAASGLFTMDADCYHTETRSEDRTVTDSDGNTKTQTTYYDVSVTTHTDHLEMTPFFTQDESGRLEDFIANNQIVTVDFKVMYYHLDSQSQRKLEQVYANFKMRNMKDDHQKFTIKYVIPNMILKKSFMFKEAGCDYSSWFYLFTLVGLIWPYSLWVESNIDRYEVKLRKAIQF